MSEEMVRMLCEALVRAIECECTDCINEVRATLFMLIPTAHQCRTAGWQIVLPWTAKDKGCLCFEKGVIADESADAPRVRSAKEVH